MVKQDKKRVMITLSLQTIEDLEKLSSLYSMPLSQVINMLVVDKLQERNMK